MPGGRPTIYSNELLSKCYEYLAKLPEDEVIHSIEGLCDYIDIGKTTAHRWENEEGKEEFRAIMENVMRKQAKSLINGGLNGKHNPTISKLILTKHNYSDRSEIQQSGTMKIKVVDDTDDDVRSENDNQDAGSGEATEHEG